MTDNLPPNDPGHAPPPPVAAIVAPTPPPPAPTLVAHPTEPAIPAHIAGNILEFLRRVQTTGMEALAWVEAYQHVQRHVPQQPGVPFTGLPQK